MFDPNIMTDEERNMFHKINRAANFLWGLDVEDMVSPPNLSATLLDDHHEAVVVFKQNNGVFFKELPQGSLYESLFAEIGQEFPKGVKEVYVLYRIRVGFDGPWTCWFFKLNEKTYKEAIELKGLS